MATAASYLLAGGEVLDVATGETKRRDVAVVDGVVAEATRHSDLTQVDAGGLTIMFGLWDVHAHPAGMMYDPRASGYFERISQHSVRAGANLVQAAAMGLTGGRHAPEAEGTGK